MTFAHKIVIALTAAVLLPLQAHAAVISGSFAEQTDQAEAQGKDRGVLQGDIVTVDFSRSTLQLQTAKGRVEIQVLPSTSIMRRGDQYGTIADLAPGVHIWVWVSEVSGHLTAQIIRIR